VPTKVGPDQPSNFVGVLGTVAQLVGAVVTLIVVARR
jgi:hypothetical protein